MGKLDQIREQFEKFKNSKTLKSGGGSTKTQFKPTKEETSVRLAPWVGDFELKSIEDLMRETFVHYKIHGTTFYCPSRNFSEDSHIQKYASELWTSGDPASQSIAKKLFSTPRYCFLVLVRGQEEDGLKIWEVSKTTAEEIIALVLTEDKEILADGGVFGDNCLDLKVNTYDHKTPDGIFTKTKIAVGRKVSPFLPKGMKVTLKSLQESAPDPLSLHERVSSDKTMEILENFMEKTTKSEDEETRKYGNSGNSARSELARKAEMVRNSENDIPPTPDEDDIPF